MTGELEKIISSVFRMGKGASLSRMEMKNLLVYNLRWFGPEDAIKVIQAALSSGLLKTEKDGEMTPTFDMEEMDVEMGYRPPDNFDTEQMARPLFERLIETIMASGLDKKETIRTINRRVDEKNLLFPCAAVHVGIERKMDMSRFYAEVENSIRFGEK